jgi:hypothetical protein
VDLSTDRANHIVAGAYSEQLGWNLGQQQRLSPQVAEPFAAAGGYTNRNGSLCCNMRVLPIALVAIILLLQTPTCLGVPRHRRRGSNLRNAHVVAEKVGDASASAVGMHGGCRILLT